MEKMNARYNSSCAERLLFRWIFTARCGTVPLFSLSAPLTNKANICIISPQSKMSATRLPTSRPLYGAARGQAAVFVVTGIRLVDS